MSDFSLRSNGFVLFCIALGFALILISLVSGATIALAVYKGVALRTFTGVRSYVISIVSDLVLPFIGGLCLIVAGWRMFSYKHRAIYRSVRSNSRKAVEANKNKVMESLLSGDEKSMVELIGKTKGGTLQSDLVIKSGFSKVKVHRILKGLENKGIVKRGRFGITNKVILSD